MTDYKPFADEYRARFGDAISCQDSIRRLTAQNHDTVAVQFNPQRFAEEIVTDLLIAASSIVSSAMAPTTHPA